jgi:hypothetical protein
MQNDPETMLNKIISRFDKNSELVASNERDCDSNYLFQRLARAALNQCCDGEATVSRYAIWADTVGGHISAAMRLIESGEKENGYRLLITAHNSLGAFSEIQKQLDPLNYEERNDLGRLVDMGFKKVGVWRRSGERNIYALDSCSESTNVLYAFICNGSVLYVGKTAQSLKKRMNGYQNPGPTQSTNIKANSLIKEMVTSGNEVEIFALPDNGLLYYGGFHVNIAAGLEDNIINALKPVWNNRGI